MTVDRIGRDRLARLRLELTSQDMAVLKRLAEHRYLQTRQLARFEFTERPTELAGLRAAHRVLKKLRQHALVLMLERTIGGPRRGSTAAIWTLTNAGLRIAAGDAQDEFARRRQTEPTLIFLRHELAVADVHLALLEGQGELGPTVTTLETEPNCWRRYVNPLGQLTTLKPDLAVEIETVQFEVKAFIEVDRATEPPHRIVSKCLQYQEYYRAQASRLGLLPIVLWIVPDEVRKVQLAKRLSDEGGVDRRLFRVLRLDEVGAFMNDDEAVGQLDSEGHEHAQ